jgi:plasmid stabilization system protein ParE
MSDSGPYHVSISSDAWTDVFAIHDYIAKHSRQNAWRMVERILDTMQSLASAPQRKIRAHGHATLRSPVRSVPVGEYLVFFRVIEDTRTVQVMAVRHGGRLIPRRLEG